MSVQLKCDICGKDFTKQPDIFYQLFIQEVTNASKHNKQICVCHECMPKNLLYKSVAAYTPTETPQEITMSQPSDDFAGMTLRDFMDSEFYMHSNNLVFKDQDGQPIDNFTLCMNCPIIKILTEDPNGLRAVLIQAPSVE